MLALEKQSKRASKGVGVAACIATLERICGRRKIGRGIADASNNVSIAIGINRDPIGAIETAAADIRRVENVSACSIDLRNEDVI